MERLRFLEEPLQPAALVAERFQLLNRTSLVDPRVMRKLRALNQGEDDRVFETDQRRTDAIKGERVSRDHEVLLHGRGVLLVNVSFRYMLSGCRSGCLRAAVNALRCSQLHSRNLNELHGTF